jgi:hypothetical protein
MFLVVISDPQNLIYLQSSLTTEKVAFPLENIFTYFPSRTVAVAVDLNFISQPGPMRFERGLF